MRGPLRKLALLLTALVLILAATPLTPAGAADEFEKYALESVGASLSTNQAGAHADFTTSFALTRSGSKPYALTRDVEVRLPPGLIGNPQGIPRCTVDQLGTQSEQAECPVDSQVGVTEVRVLNPISGTFTEPVYNMDPPGGDVVARLGFYAVGWPAFINVRVDPTDYSLIASIEGAPSTAGSDDHAVGGAGGTHPRRTENHPGRGKDRGNARRGAPGYRAREALLEQSH
jgi:hypothetical protein